MVFSKTVNNIFSNDHGVDGLVAEINVLQRLQALSIIKEGLEIK